MERDLVLAEVAVTGGLAATPGSWPPILPHSCHLGEGAGARAGAGEEAGKEQEKKQDKE